MQELVVETVPSRPRVRKTRLMGSHLRIGAEELVFGKLISIEEFGRVLGILDASVVLKSI